MMQKVWNDMFEGGSLWAGLLNGGYSQMRDTFALYKGEIGSDDYGVRSTKNVTNAIGTMAGVEIGVVIGTAILPGFGTTLGSVIGGFLGDRLGTYAGIRAGQLIFKPDGQNGTGNYVWEIEVVE